MAKRFVLVYGTDPSRLKSVAQTYRDAGWIAQTRDLRHFRVDQIEQCDHVRMLQPDGVVASAFRNAGITVEVEDGDARSASPSLDNMSVVALRALAKARGVSLHANLRRRDRIIARLRAQLGADANRSEDHP